MLPPDKNTQQDDTYEDGSAGTSDPDSPDDERHSKKLMGSFLEPDVTVAIDYDPSSSEGEMADLMGVNRGVLTGGRYRMPDNSVWPADFTRLYQAIGVTSVRTHGDCFDIASIFGLFPDTEVPLVDDLPIEHSIELEEYWTENASGDAIRLVAPAEIEDARAEILEKWKVLFGNTDRQLTWGPGKLGDLYGEFDAAQETDLDGAEAVLAAASNNLRSWLHWHPVGTEIANSSNYRTIETGAAAAYRALIDAGIEVYFRVGESMSGPTFLDDVLLPNEHGSYVPSKLQYADVAKQILSDLISYNPEQLEIVSPGFIEIWNEPDGEFYANIHGDNDVRFGADFGQLYGAIECQLRPDQFPENTATPIGGSGFTRTGMSDFLDKLAYPADPNIKSKVYEILAHSSPEQFDFISFHWYSNSADDDEVLKGSDFFDRCFLARALTFAEDLSRFTRGLRSYFSGEGEGEYREIHVSEWNIQLPDAAGSTESVLNWCVGIECAAFVSAAMTWMQSSTIGVTKAHFFAGRDEEGGLFHFDLGEVLVPNARGDLVPVLRHRFKIRPSAVAFSLYSDLAGKSRFPVTFPSDRPLGGRPMGVIRAARTGVDVTAVAFAGDENYEFILTNLSGSTRDVNIKIRGLPLATYQVNSRNVDPEMPHDGFVIPDDDLEWGTRCQPMEGVAEAAIESCLKSSVRGFVTSSGPDDPAFIGVKLQAYGVMRVWLEVT